MYQSEGEIRLTEEERGRDKSEGEMEYRYSIYTASMWEVGNKEKDDGKKSWTGHEPIHVKLEYLIFE